MIQSLHQRQLKIVNAQSIILVKLSVAHNWMKWATIQLILRQSIYLCLTSNSDLQH